MPLLTKGIKPYTPPVKPEPSPDDPRRIELLTYRIISESHDAFFALSSMRRLHEKQVKLLPKLENETLQDDPAYARAAMHSIGLDRQMATLLNVIASSETDAQRAWEQLQPEDREDAAHWWNADVNQSSLIGQSFKAWPECEIPADFPVIHLPRILRNLSGWPAFEDWRREGVYRP